MWHGLVHATALEAVGITRGVVPDRRRDPGNIRLVHLD